MQQLQHQLKRHLPVTFSMSILNFKHENKFYNIVLILETFPKLDLPWYSLGGARPPVFHTMKVMDNVQYILI